MNIGGLIIFVVGMIALAGYFWRELFPKDEVYDKRWMLNWIAKGVLLPIVAWVLVNIGSHPVMPTLIALQPPSSPGRLASFLFGINYVCAQTRPALFVIGSYWAALTIGWLAVIAVSRAAHREDFIISSLAWCALLSPVVALLLYLYGLKVVGLALLIWVCPLAQHALSLRPMKTLPAYAHATANLKFGKYRQAEQAILIELEKCETDFDGWLMLAELYAKQFHDPAEAERTIHGLCNEPATTLAQAAIALNRLADWQLQLRNDPVAARRALEEIVRRGPGTHLAKMAELRMKHLPATSEEWQEQHRTRTIHLPALGDQLDAPQNESAPQISPAKALALANRCVEKLHENPADVPTREKLAEILADQLGKTGMAVEQIESLMEMPGQPPEKMAAWLALIAAWEIRQGGDRQAARQHLERLIREYPASVQALAARRRLDVLDMEQQPAPDPGASSSTGTIRLSNDGAV